MIMPPDAQSDKIMLIGLKRPPVSLLIALVLAGLALLPMIAVLLALLSGRDPATDHVFATTLPRYIQNSLLLMIGVGAISLFIGVTAAWFVTVAAFPGRRVLSWLLVLPLAAPAYIVAYLYTDLLEFSGPVQSGLRSLFNWQSGDYVFPPTRSLGGAMLMLGLVLYPYVYILARAAFRAQSRAQFQAARTLGLTATRAFFKVALPGARPAIIGGLALVMMETLADFGVADYFAIPTFSTGIFRTWLAMGETQSAMKLAGVMLLFVIALIMIEKVSQRGRVTSDHPLADDAPMFELNGAKAWGATAFCAVPVLLGFVVPVCVLLNLALTDGDTQPLRAIIGFITNSLTLAGITAGLATVIALFFAYRERQISREISVGLAARLSRGSLRLATLGYALPGALLAIGLLGPLGAFDQALTRWSRDVLGLSHGLLLTGTLALLIYALIIRFLTVSFNSVSSGMEKLPLALDDAARTLGARPLSVVQRLHIPLLSPSLAAGVALVFIDVMRELPATLILRPFNFETLATRVYRLASDERLAEASTSALIIVLVGLLPVLFLSRLGRR